MASMSNSVGLVSKSAKTQQPVQPMKNALGLLVLVTKVENFVRKFYSGNSVFLNKQINTICKITSCDGLRAYTTGLKKIVTEAFDNYDMLQDFSKLEKEVNKL